MTRERCLKKASKMDFARVLVEVSAEDDLPNVLEIEYPPLGNKPARVGKSVTDDDGFTVVGKKNKPAASQFVDQAKVGGHNRWSGRGLNNMKQGYGNSGSGNSNFYRQRRVGGYVQRYQYQQKSNSNAGNVKSGGNFNNTSKSSVQKEKKKSIVDKPILASVFNHNYRPKGENVKDLGDINVNEEFKSKVWPNLKEEVDILLEVGIYPSKQVRLDSEDDEGDVDSDDEGFAWNVRGLNSIPNQNQVIQLLWEDNYSFRGLLKTHVKKKNLSRICNRVLGRWDWVSNSSSCDSEDIAMTGLNFTWNKKPGKDGGLLKKLDRVLGNSHFMSIFPLSYALFLPYMLSDHTPAVLVMPKISNAKPEPFKFHNYLTAKDDFIPVVRNVWNSKIDGFSMFSLVFKLKLLKKPLRKLNFKQGNLFENVVCLKAKLAGVQSSLSADPHNKALREEELRVLKAYRAALKDEELFLRQKAKVEWLRAGDSNSSYFHNVVKGRCNRNKNSFWVKGTTSPVKYITPKKI
nr:hypothetical protein [Tanacetum cinerariifolium]